MKTKKQKRKEAVERNEAWSKLSLKEKLVELDKRPGKQTKQRKRLSQ
jgi:hypothetical protein